MNLLFLVLYILFGLNIKFNIRVTTFFFFIICRFVKIKITCFSKIRFLPLIDILRLVS